MSCNLLDRHPPGERQLAQGNAAGGSKSVLLRPVRSSRCRLEAYAQCVGMVARGARLLGDPQPSLDVTIYCSLEETDATRSQIQDPCTGCRTAEAPRPFSWQADRRSSQADRQTRSCGGQYACPG